MERQALPWISLCGHHCVRTSRLSNLRFASMCSGQIGVRSALKDFGVKNSRSSVFQKSHVLSLQFAPTEIVLTVIGGTMKKMQAGNQQRMNSQDILDRACLFACLSTTCASLIMARDSAEFQFALNSSLGIVLANVIVFTKRVSSRCEISTIGHTGERLTAMSAARAFVVVILTMTFVLRHALWGVR